MRGVLISVFILSVAGMAAAVALPDWQYLLPACAALALISALVWVVLRRRRPAGRPDRPLVIDGSNAMFWRDNQPRIDTVKALVDHVAAQGFTAGVIFDASAGHVLFGRYLDDRHFAKLLGLPENRCFVVPKGTIADEYILRAARDIGARIVTNDRYRDWAGDFPEVTEPGHLIRGRFNSGKLTLTPPLQDTGA